MRAIFAAGGTGGHIFSAVTISKDTIFSESLLISDKKFLNYENCDTDITYKILPILPRSSGIFNKISFIMSLGISYAKALYYIYKFQPDVVIGFGGYPSFPTVIAAITLRKIVILHEQNSVMGLANRMVLKFVHSAMLGFKKTKFTNKFSAKCVYTGNPINSHILKLRKKEFTFDPTEKTNILIIGGSQASTVLGTIIPKAIQHLPESLRNNIHITHQVPKHLVLEVEKLYQSLNIHYEVSHFFQNMHEKLADTHIAISRAGAISLTELAISGIPSILIPLAKSADNHQFENATIFTNNGGATLIQEHELSINRLADTLHDMLANPTKVISMSTLQKSQAPKNQLKKIIKHLESSINI